MSGVTADNSLLQFVVDVFYRKAIDPTSSLFLPKAIQGQTNPTYEPYLAGQWEPVNLTQGTTSAAAVCAGQGGSTENYIAPPDAIPTIVLSEVTIYGVSNVLPSPPQVNGDVVTASATFSTYDASIAPKPLTVKGNFQLTQYCCLSKDFKTCDQPAEQFVGTGTFTSTINVSSITTSVLVGVSGGGDSLTANVQTLEWQASADASNIQGTVDITSIPKDANRDYWNTYAEEALNSTEARAGFVKNVQQVLAQQSTLDSLSQLLTQAIQSILKESQQDVR